MKAKTREFIDATVGDQSIINQSWLVDKLERYARAQLYDFIQHLHETAYDVGVVSLKYTDADTFMNEQPDVT